MWNTWCPKQKLESLHCGYYVCIMMSNTGAYRRHPCRVSLNLFNCYYSHVNFKTSSMSISCYIYCKVGHKTSITLAVQQLELLRISTMLTSKLAPCLYMLTIFIDAHCFYICPLCLDMLTVLYVHTVFICAHRVYICSLFYMCPPCLYMLTIFIYAHWV
jgi:hypothetical protein